MALPPEICPVPFAEHAGPIRRVATGEGWRLSFAASEVHGNGRDIVHGGMLATLLDEAMGQLAEAAAGVRCTTVELGVTYLAPVPTHGDITAEAKILRLGHSLVFAEATVFDADGTAAARGQAVLKLLR